MLAHFGFLIRECWLNIRRQGLMALACVSTSAIALSTLGACMVMAFHLHSVAQHVQKPLEVHAFMHVDTPREETEAVQAQIRQMGGIAWVKLVPKETAWEELQKTHPEYRDGLNENPLPDKIEVKTVRPELAIQVADAIRAIPQVEAVKEERALLRNLVAIANVVRWVGIVGISLLALGTAAIISNAIRMTLYARRRDIRVMQLVGATNQFIRLPFVMEGLFAGVVGGALAFGLLAGGLQYITTRALAQLPFASEFHIGFSFLQLAGVLIGGGALLGMFGSMFSLRRFLKAA